MEFIKLDCGCVDCFSPNTGETAVAKFCDQHDYLEPKPAMHGRSVCTGDGCFYCCAGEG